MAASSCGARRKNQHKRRNPCTNRPLYRDGRREKAVKVFTINQESRYLLVQGVPDINITDELLKLFSLYGAVEEYRIVDDLPAEEFTKNYWIKYEDIQAARIAKRKMDDHSFYGGFLHVTYAPEYESIQDTREKLQQRRMAVARRLRKLAQEKAENDSEDCIETIAPSSQVVPSEKPSGSVPSKAWGLPTDQPLKGEGIQPQHLIAGCQASQGVCRDDPAPLSGQHEAIPSLPAPPQRLPPWQWNIPSQPEFPRLRTSHETLPVGFNPFPTVADYQQGNVSQHLAQPPPPPPPPITQLAPLGTFIGPQSPPSIATSSGNLRSADYANRDSEGGRTQYLSTGDRCIVRTKACGSTRKSDAFQGESLGVYEHRQDTAMRSGSDGQECTDGGVGLSEGVRPKLVARRRLGSQAANSSTQPSAGRHRDHAGTSAKASKPQFLPRVVSTRTKRSAASVEEPEESERSSLPVTGDASLDQTVSTIRQQMFEASVVSQTGANPISQLQATIIRSRNQERMGLLPRRPPVKRQRI